MGVRLLRQGEETHHGFGITQDLPVERNSIGCHPVFFERINAPKTNLFFVSLYEPS